MSSSRSSTVSNNNNINNSSQKLQINNNEPNLAKSYLGKYYYFGTGEEVETLGDLSKYILRSSNRTPPLPVPLSPSFLFLIFQKSNTNFIFTLR